MWLPILWFLLAAVAAFVAYLALDWLAVVFTGVLVTASVLWVFGCIFSPARPDRRCPNCGKEGLVKLRRGEPVGVCCEHCDYSDAERHVAYLDEW